MSKTPKKNHQLPRHRAEQAPSPELADVNSRLHMHIRQLLYVYDSDGSPEQRAACLQAVRELVSQLPQSTEEQSRADRVARILDTVANRFPGDRENSHAIASLALSQLMDQHQRHERRERLVNPIVDTGKLFVSLGRKALGIPPKDSQK